MPYDPYAEDQIAPGYGNAVAFDIPRDDELRYPIATPSGGSWNPTPEQYPGIVTTRAASDAAYAARDQYNAELARAERNRAEEQAVQDPQSIQQAVRLRGLLKYQQMIRDGANPSEAIRIAAPELYFNHPMASVQATHMADPVVQPSITTVPVPGGNAVLSNGKLHSVLKTPAPPRPLPPVKEVVPADAKALQDNNKTLIEEAQKDLERAKKAMDKAETPDEKSSSGRAALAAQNNLDKLLNNRTVLSTNYPHATSPPNIVTQALKPPPAEDDMVPVTGPDGVRGRVPRSKLDAAIKQGYKER